MRRLAIQALFLFAPLAPAHTAAAEPNPDATDGVVTPERVPSDPARKVASGALYLPRRLVELAFVATGTAAGLVRDEQLVPRVEELLSPRPGEVTAFPFLFFATGRAPSVGAKAIAVGQSGAASLAAGYGPPQDGLAEGRLRFGAPKPLPLVASLEGLFDRRTQLTFLGIGQTPGSDPRNRFVPGLEGARAHYLEERSRLIASVGARPFDDVSVVVSGSYLESRIGESPYADELSLKDVFAKGSLGPIERTARVYGEVELRLDTRQATGRPSSGVLAEGYVGYHQGVDTDVAAVQTGGRFVGFVPIRRATNIASLGVAVDGIVPTSSVELPFTLLLRQPDFRGVDDRRDRTSMVATIDYRWAFARFLAARVFVDAATVAPHPRGWLTQTPRPATGFGLDLFSRSTELGRAALSFSPDGVRFLLSFGLSTSTDRQHRD